MQDKTTNLILNSKPIQFQIFDYLYYSKKYTDQRFDDESVGLDIISYCLEHDKTWEPFQTEITAEILKEDKNGIFIDVGCQLGYYSTLASLIGTKTFSIDSCNSFLTLFNKTITNNNLTNIKIVTESVDENFNLVEHIPSPVNINLIKIDIEGSEKFLINSIDTLLSEKKIKNIIMEISPRLDKDYDTLCVKLHSYGYKIYDIGLSPQRKLQQNTNHLQDIDKLMVNIDNISEYIQNIQHNQSNFLFRL